MNVPGAIQCVLRQPQPEEMGRVMHLFRNHRVPAAARFIGALKRVPVERFIAAAAWWVEGPIARFKLVSQPGLTERDAVCGLLIDQVARDCAATGIACLHYGELLPDESEWVTPLRERGFSLLRSERFFQVSTAQARIRTTAVFERHRAEIPGSWRTAPIRDHGPETILDLIAPYRLMPVEELRQAWKPDSVKGFHLDCSCILFDDAQPLGVLLLRELRDAYLVDVRVVRSGNRLLRSLGNVLLFHHLAQRHDPAGPIHWLQFRGGESEHRETANIALRMGGRELPRRHVFARVLRSDTAEPERVFVPGSARINPD